MTRAMPEIGADDLGHLTPMRQYGGTQPFQPGLTFLKARRRGLEEGIALAIQQAAISKSGFG